MANSNKRVPMNHVIGFVLSLVMTLVAAWAVIGSDLPTNWVVIFIMILALLQAGVQLFMFMHVTEAASGNGHVPWNMMFHGFSLAAIVVAGSIFVMSFGFSHDHGDDGGNHEQHEEQEQQDHSGH